MSEFHFLRPYWFLALIPLAILLWLLWQRRYQSRSWRAVCDPRLLPYLLTDTVTRQRRWPLVALALGSLLLILALAGPVWEKIEQPVFRQQTALVIVLDLSRSMDATDIRPSRLARARHKVIDILQQRKEGQTALLVYAADAYTVSPLTEDSNTIIAMVKALNTGLMPVQGSATEQALVRATALLKQAGALHGHILLITDGIIPSQAERLAGLISQHGHRLSVLGIGTANGAPITIEGGGFLKDRSGHIVVPRLDSSSLSQLARLAGGRYRSLTADEGDLSDLLTGMADQGIDVQRKETTFIADRWREQGPWLLLIVLPFAALAFRKGYLLIAILLSLPGLPQPVQALEWEGLWQRPEQKAAKQLQQATDPQALPSAELFSDPQWKASAHYRAGQYPQAVEALQGIDEADALYNKGNALAKMGKLAEAIEAYDQALQHEPDHADAKYNRQQVAQQLQQQPPQDGQNKSKNSSSGQSEQQQDPSKDKQNGDQEKESSPSSPQEQKEDQAQAEKSDQNGAQKPQEKRPEPKDGNHSEQANNTQPVPDKDQNKDKPEKSPQQAAESQELNKQKEITQATEQWLRRIPDDPGGLLRRKFQYEYQRQQRKQTTTNSDNGQSAW